MAASPATRFTPPLFAGIDVGGTNVKIGLVDDAGERIAYESIPTEPNRGADSAAARMGATIRELCERTGVSVDDLARVGLVTPGPMDLAAGMLLCPGNLPAWHNTPIRDLVAQACGRPVTFANDANAAAYGEYWRGAGRTARSMVMFTMGTGVGGGIVIEDMLIEGRHGCGAELGHLVIDYHDDAPESSLKLRGVLEGFCGAYGITARAIAAIETGAASSLRSRIDRGEKLTPLVIAEEAERGDALALKIIDDTARLMGVGVATAIHAIDPDIVVIGGAVTFGGAGHPLGEKFIADIRAETEPRLIPSIRGAIAIGFAELGSDAGYIGAAGLARREAMTASTQ